MASLFLIVSSLSSTRPEDLPRFSRRSVIVASLTFVKCPIDNSLPCHVIEKQGSPRSRESSCMARSPSQTPSPGPPPWGSRRSGIPWNLPPWQAWPRPTDQGPRTEMGKNMMKSEKFHILNINLERQTDAYYRKLRFWPFLVTQTRNKARGLSFAREHSCDIMGKNCFR